MVFTKSNHRSPISIVQNLLVALSVVSTFLIVWWLIKYSTYGIDFTDEGFHLVWIANPFLYDGSVTQFGFVYHPLYWLLDGDIGALRQVNILITLGLAWGLTYLFLDSLVSDLKKGQVTLVVASAALATSAFIIFDSGLRTPNYNSLNLQALLVTSIGLVLAEEVPHRKSIIGWVLIGIGGWLAFMAKPSTAAVLAGGVFVYLLFAGKLSFRMLTVSALCTLASILLSAVMIDWSVAGFVKRIQLGMEFADHLGGGHTLSQIFRIDGFKVGEYLKFTIYLVSSMLFLAIWSFSTISYRWSFIGLLISLMFFAFIASITLGFSHWRNGFGSFQGLLTFAVVFGVMLMSLVLGRTYGLKTISKQQWSMAILFLLMPHIYAFGTNNNYWQSGSSAGIFWILAGLTLLAPVIRLCASWVLVLPVALATQAVTVSTLQIGLEHPYRQPQPLRLNTINMEIGPESSVLTLSDGYAAYISAAITTAKESGFKKNTALIDMSGQSPGILFALEAQNIGQPWTLGGYPGSLDFVEAGLSRFSCEEISQAWVLVEPDGPRKIPDELMSKIGADFPENFKQVGSWQTAEGAGGYAQQRVQELYKPLDKRKTLLACKNVRTRLMP